MKGVLDIAEASPLVVPTGGLFHLSDDEFFEFCRINRELRIERTANGDIVIMSPAGAESSSRNASLTAQLHSWAVKDGSGRGFDSSAGFTLPSGATRSPDDSWIARSRLVAINPERKKKFLPLCPDFVVELRSPADRLTDLQKKMQEYMENGARLGWLIDPESEPRRVYVYRPGQDVQIVDNPATLSADPELPGFELDLRDIWEPGL